MGLSAGEADADPAVVVSDPVVVEGVDVQPVIAMTAHVVIPAILATRPIRHSSPQGVMLTGAYCRPGGGLKPEKSLRGLGCFRSKCRVRQSRPEFEESDSYPTDGWVRMQSLCWVPLPDNS